MPTEPPPTAPTHPTRRGRLITAGLLTAGLLLSAGCTGKPADAPAPPPPAPPTSPTGASVTPTPKPPAPKPAPVDPLTGGRPSGNEVFAVKVENTLAARPQIGLKAADIIVAEQVEAGITRLIAIYHTDFPTRVGPVRSARNTDVQYLPMFGRPGLVYSGANSKVQAQIRRASVVAIERSDRDRSRSAPHNVMVNLAALAARHQVGTVKDVGLRFAPTDPRWTGAKPGASGSSRIGNDTFGFTATAKGYLIRWQGRTYNDGAGDLTVDNVVVLSVRNRKDTDSTSSISVVSETVGKGAVSVYRDGKVLTGTWTRANVAGAMVLRDAAGKDIPLKPGRTWIMLQGR